MKIKQISFMMREMAKYLDYEYLAILADELDKVSVTGIEDAERAIFEEFRALWNNGKVSRSFCEMVHKHLSQYETEGIDIEAMGWKYSSK